MAGRPASLAMFDGFYLAGRFVSILPAAYGAIFQTEELDPELQGIGIGIYYILIFSPIVPPLLLWYFVSRRASNVAKWLLFAWVAYESIAIAANALSPQPEYAGYRLVFAAIVAFDVAAVLMLNRAEARKWFKLKGRFGGIDPQTFD